MKTDKENEDRQHECGVKIDIHKEDGKQDENIPCGAYSNEGLETMDSDQVDYAQSESKSQTQIRIEEDTNNHSQFPMVENTLDPKTGDEESLRTIASDENLESYNSNTSNDINDDRPRHAKLKLPKHNHSNLHSTSDSKLPENNELPPLSRIKRSFTRLQHIPFNDREYDIKDDDEYKLGDGTLLFEENQVCYKLLIVKTRNLKRTITYLLSVYKIFLSCFFIKTKQCQSFCVLRISFLYSWLILSKF